MGDWGARESSRLEDKDLKIICGGTGQRGTRCPKMGRESLRQGPWPITLGRKPWNLQILILPLLSRVNSGECELSGSHLPDCKWGERAPHRHWLPLGNENPENCASLWILVTSGPGLTSAAVVLDLEAVLPTPGRVRHPHPTRLQQSGSRPPLLVGAVPGESARQEGR